MEFSPPIILVSAAGDLEIFPTVAAMQGNVESIDVDAGEWVEAIDCEGRELVLTTGGESQASRFRVRDTGVGVSLREGTRTSDARVREVLIRALEQLGPQTRGGRTLGARLESLSDKSTAELLDMARTVAAP